VPFGETRYRWADGYDDEYSATPRYVVEHFYNLGFRKLINIYIGASHFYDKRGTDEELPGEPIPWRYELKPTPVFNQAFEAWWGDFLAWAKHYGFEKIIASISMENVDAPPDWWQMTADGTPATTAWTPTPHLLSFCNPDLQAYYKSYVKALADAQAEAGLPVCVQLGEPWWWWLEGTEGKPPCFYDDATRAAYQSQFGCAMPEYLRSDIEDYDQATIDWLRAQNGGFAVMLRDYLRGLYPDAEFTVLFFPPSVLDEDRVPAMMRDVNFPVEQWRNRIYG
jgi:hypothetical protein